MTSQSFREFTIRLLELLKARWQPRKTQYSLRAVVCFRLRRDGTVASAEVRKASGDMELDHAALDLVRSDVVFPPLPSDVGENAIFAFNFDSDSEESDLQGAGVPRKPVLPQRESSAELREPE